MNIRWRENKVCCLFFSLSHLTNKTKTLFVCLRVMFKGSCLNVFFSQHVEKAFKMECTLKWVLVSNFNLFTNSFVCSLTPIVERCIFKIKIRHKKNGGIPRKQLKSKYIHLYPVVMIQTTTSRIIGHSRWKLLNCYLYFTIILSFAPL